MDVENGTLGVADVPVPHMRPQTWPEIRDLIVRIAGPNRSFPPQEPYSQAHFDMCGGYLPGVETGISNDFLRHGDRRDAAHLIAGRRRNRSASPSGRQVGSAQRLWIHAREMLLALHHLQSARSQRHPDRRA